MQGPNSKRIEIRGNSLVKRGWSGTEKNIRNQTPRAQLSAVVANASMLLTDASPQWQQMLSLFQSEKTASSAANISGLWHERDGKYWVRHAEMLLFLDLRHISCLSSAHSSNLCIKKGNTKP